MDQIQILTIVAVSVPTMITVLLGILINNSLLGDLRSDMNARFNDLRACVDVRFTQVDARLKHLEER